MTDEERRIGRPKLPDDARRGRTIHVRLTAAEGEQFDLLGGSDWLRRALRRAFARLKKGGGAGG